MIKSGQQTGQRTGSEIRNIPGARQGGSSTSSTTTTKVPPTAR